MKKFLPLVLVGVVSFAQGAAEQSQIEQQADRLAGFVEKAGQDVEIAAQNIAKAAESEENKAALKEAGKDLEQTGRSLRNIFRKK